MQGIHHFVIKPLGDRYENEKSIGGKKLIINSEISNHEYVNRRAIVVSCPRVNESCIKAGDEIIVHHNVFRRWYDVKGKEKNSKAYFKDGLYLVDSSQIFLVKKEQWTAMPGFSFVQPIKNEATISSSEKEDPHKGIIKYTDGSTRIGDLVGYTPSSKYEFVVDNQRLYRVYNKFITIKYEYQGNEEAYNPSWT